MSRPPSRPPGPAPLPRLEGPAWISRAGLVVSAAWLVLFGAAIGAGFELAHAAAEIVDQRYAELGFARSAFLLLERGADRGVYAGTQTALWYLTAVLLASALVPVRRLFDPAELCETLVSKERLLRLEVVIAALFLAASLFSDSVVVRSVSGESTLEVAGLAPFTSVASAAFAILGLELVARRLRRPGRAVDPTERATAFAAALAIGVVALLAREALEPRPGIPLPWRLPAGIALLFAGGAAAFVLVRRAVLESQRTRAPAGRTSLGGRVVRALLLLLVLPAAAPLAVRAAAAALGHSRVHAHDPLDVIVVIVDGLRADSIDLVEPPPGGRDRTPNLRRLAERGVAFTRAISPSPEPFGAAASLLTGRHVLEHGAVPGRARVQRGELLLAEILREASYRTGAFVTSPELAGPRGFGQGVDEFSGRHIGDPGAISSHLVTNQAMWFVERHAREPFFLLAQYADPRPDWRDHPGWNWAEWYSGWLRRAPSIEEAARDLGALSDDDRRWLRDLVDEEVAFTDGEIGRLVDALGRAGLDERSVVVVVGTQGVELLERGGLGLGRTLHEELVRVPLIVVQPGGRHAGERVDSTVETRSVLATVLGRLGVEREPPPGTRDLLAEGDGATTSPPGPPRAFSVLARAPATGGSPRIEQASVTEDRWKLLLDVSREREMLYDLAADPREQVPLAPEAPGAGGEFTRLHAELERWIDAETPARLTAPPHD